MTYRFSITLPLLVLFVALPVAGQEPDHAKMHAMHHGAVPAAKLTSGGDAVFEALAEVVALLESDPATDWSSVDIDALRAHLLDMNALFERAQASSEEIPGGARFRITGPPEALAAAARMVPAHSRMLESEAGMRASAAVRDDEVLLEVTGPDDASAARIRGLGFFGLMASGEHHRAHHLAIALGRKPHG